MPTASRFPGLCLAAVVVAAASCARPVLVAGFPLRLVSHHAISVVGRVSVIGAMIGEDRLHVRAVRVDVALGTVVLAAAREPRSA